MREVVTTFCGIVGAMVGREVVPFSRLSGGDVPQRPVETAFTRLAFQLVTAKRVPTFGGKMDRPIIFSAPMIRALLAGRKTQTRRILKPQPESQVNGKFHIRGTGGGCFDVDESSIGRIAADYCRFAPGDRLWVRENFNADGEGPVYAAEWPLHDPCAPRWRPSIHMPRWASRLTLLVESVKVERLQDISEVDAIAEGIAKSPHGNGDQWLDYPEGSSAAGWIDPRASFRSLWKSIHGADGWIENPYVAAISFRVVKENIDSLEKEAA